MSVTLSLKQTSSGFFKIGKTGMSVLQGTSAPLSIDGTSGDLFIEHSNNPKVYQKNGSVWQGLTRPGNVTSTGTNLTNNRIAIFSGTTGKVIAGSSIYIADRTIGLLDRTSIVKDSDKAIKRKEVLFNTTTNATETELFLNGTSGQILVPLRCSIFFEVFVTGMDASGDAIEMSLRGSIVKHTANASTQIVGGVYKEKTSTDNASAWDVNISADTSTGAISVKVIGEAAKTIKWVATVETTESIHDPVAVYGELTGGTAIGDAVNGGGLSAAFTDPESKTHANSARSPIQTTAGTIGKDWGVGQTRTVDRYDIWGSSDFGYDSTLSAANITVTLRGSNNGSTWTTLHSLAPFADTNTSNPKSVTTGINTSTAYRYHTVTFQTSSSSQQRVMSRLKLYGWSYI